jgi:hypothetical protein
MFTEIEKIYHLYIYQLNFLVALKDLAENQIEIAKNKYIKTEEDIILTLNSLITKCFSIRTKRRKTFFYFKT